jgi:sodium/potassium-transporting ATPase subunit alpha
MYTAFQSNNDDESIQQFSRSAPGMTEMVDIAALNSKIKFDKTDVPFEERQILGDATETGLARFAGRSLPTDVGYDAHHKNHPKVFEGTFFVFDCGKRTHVAMFDSSLQLDE